MDPLTITIGGGLVSAIAYLYHRQERAQDRCEKREESMGKRIDALEHERSKVLVDLTAAIKDISRAVKATERHEFQPHPASRAEHG